jgi:hypothetical protein
MSDNATLTSAHATVCEALATIMSRNATLTRAHVTIFEAIATIMSGNATFTSAFAAVSASHAPILALNDSLTLPRDPRVIAWHTTCRIHDTLGAAKPPLSPNPRPITGFRCHRNDPRPPATAPRPVRPDWRPPPAAG